MEEELVGRMQELAKEKRAILRNLLGVDVPERLEAFPPGLNPFEVMLDFLPADKQANAMEIEQQLTTRIA